MLNRWEGIGRLGREVEMRYLQDGTAVASFSVACDEKWRDRSGEEQKRTEWVKCVAFDKLAQICGEYLSKGMLVFVSGRLGTREYEKGGEKKYITEIRLAEMKMLSSKHDMAGSTNKEHGRGNGEPPRTAAPSTAVDWDDDVPF